MSEGMNGFLEALTTTPTEIELTDTLPEGLKYKQDYPKAIHWLHGLVNHSNGAFDIDKVLNLIGVKTIYEQMDEDNTISGYIERLHNSWRIAVNRYENSGRQRFTLAHELAHLLFHREIVTQKLESSTDRRFTEAIKLFRSKDDYRHEEMEANAFAAELLMPSEEFRAVWSNASSIRRVSQHFNVSLYAAEYRAKKLKLDIKEL